MTLHMKRLFLYFTGLCLCSIVSFAQSNGIAVNERQVFIPLLEIEDFSRLTPDSMDGLIKNHSFAPKIQKRELNGTLYYTLNLQDEKFTFIGLKLRECGTSFSSNNNPHKRITSINVTLEFSSSTDDEAMVVFKNLVNLLNKSKLVKTKIKLESNTKKKTSSGEIYQTPFFVLSADTYAARNCYMKLSTENPELNNVSSVGDTKKIYTIKLGLLTLFYRDGNEWICVEKPYWKETGKFLK